MGLVIYEYCISMVGRSIASMHMYKTEVNMLTVLVYRGYGPTFYTTGGIMYGERF